MPIYARFMPLCVEKNIVPPKRGGSTMRAAELNTEEGGGLRYLGQLIKNSQIVGRGSTIWELLVAAACAHQVSDLAPEHESSLVPKVLVLRQQLEDCDDHCGGIPVNYDDLVTLPHDRGGIVFLPADNRAARHRGCDMRLLRQVAGKPTWRAKIFNEIQE